jgi:arylsulfatase A-like enzyme
MKKPNILMIVTDQHRYDSIGYAKSSPVLTPNIDRLASEGMWFSNAYTPIPICCPARQTLLNGQRCEAFGALWNYDITLKIPALEPEMYTWTKALQQIDYNMAYIGKWHVHKTFTPLDYGFDYYYSEGDYYQYRQLNHPDKSIDNKWFGQTDPIPLEDSKTHILARKAVEKIEEYSKSNNPWHIRLDYSEPHLPCNPCKEFADLYKPEDMIEWGSFKDDFHNKPYIQKQNVVSWDLDEKTWEDWSFYVARYYAVISQIDDAVGKVLAALKESGQEEETIVVFTTDHGDMCGAHRMIDKHCVMYDDIVKVPLIIKWPGVVEKNSRSSDFVYNFLDIQPTILEGCGLEIQPFFHGRSLTNMLKGQTEEDWRKEVVSTYNGQQFGLYCQRMLRNEHFKYIWNMTDVDELYDMVNDPYELENLSHNDNFKETLSEMRLKLYELLKKEGDDILRTPFIDNQLLKNRKC